MACDLSAARWRKASASTATGQDCVEVADLRGSVAVRDSKNPDGPALLFSRAEWAAFADTVKRAG